MKRDPVPWLFTLALLLLLLSCLAAVVYVAAT
jgi:hypothetical protein